MRTLYEASTESASIYESSRTLRDQASLCRSPVRNYPIISRFERVVLSGKAQRLRWFVGHHRSGVPIALYRLEAAPTCWPDAHPRGRFAMRGQVKVSVQEARGLEPFDRFLGLRSCASLGGPNLGR
jgi:hypothetical protein